MTSTIRSGSTPGSSMPPTDIAPQSPETAQSAVSPASGRTAMPLGGPLASLSKRSRVDSSDRQALAANLLATPRRPLNETPRRPLNETPRRPLNELPAPILSDIVSRLDAQQRIHARFHSMMTVAGADRTVFMDTAKRNRAIAEAGKQSLRAEDEVNRKWGSIDQMLDKVAGPASREIGAKADKWHRNKAFGSMDPLPASGLGKLLQFFFGRPTCFKPTIQHIYERIKSFQRLDEALAEDLIERVLHLPDAKDRQQALALLQEEIAQTEPKIAQSWNEYIENKRAEIEKKERDTYWSHLPNLEETHFLYGGLPASRVIRDSLPDYPVAMRNKVFDRILNAPKEKSTYYGMEAMAAHTDVLDESRRVALFDAAKAAPSVGSPEHLTRVLQEMANHLGELPPAQQEEFVRLVVGDADTDRKYEMIGRLLGSSDARVGRNLVHQLLQALDSDPRDHPARICALNLAISEGSGFTHHAAPQREQLVRMAFEFSDNQIMMDSIMSRMAHLESATCRQLIDHVIHSQKRWTSETLLKLVEAPLTPQDRAALRAIVMSART
ncbi:hypothetical protein [Xanthomonas hortorum]|uniref:hypothetical protein n=1 Tax=Xanthomonas hortorum TaxID=56454 RepID=UPI001E3F55B8|nr:hypothetical protein [Xanthomonas hortorum]MCC8552651.1 hypothetical protein [Xanthomonas hortorum pv. gardneri]